MAIRNWSEILELFGSTLGLKVEPAKFDPVNDQVSTGATADQTGGLSSARFVSSTAPATFDTQVIKASAGRLYAYWFFNGDGAELAYVKFYDKATAPDPSADQALLKWEQFLIPLDTAVPGIKVVSLTLPHGLAFANGISIAVTQDADTGETAVDAGDVRGYIAYK